DNVASTGNDGEYLQAHNEIDNPVTSAEFFVRAAEPVSQYAIFRDAIEHAVGANDGSIDGAGKYQEADHDNKDPEDHLQNMRPDHVHGHAGDQVIAINRDPAGIGDDHDGQQGAKAGKHEAEDRDDQRGAFQVAQLGAGNFTVHLGQR